jgi:hypothetical protein
LALASQGNEFFHFLIERFQGKNKVFLASKRKVLKTPCVLYLIWISIIKPKNEQSKEAKRPEMMSVLCRHDLSCEDARIHIPAGMDLFVRPLQDRYQTVYSKIL